MLVKTLMVIAGLVAAVVLLLAAAVLNNRVPLTDPPGLLARLRAYLGTNQVETSADSAFPELRSMRLMVPPEQFHEQLPAVLSNLGWQPHPASSDGLHWVVTTALLRFKDDLVLQIRSDDAGVNWLDVRASSRVGRADLGANTRHVMSLRARLVDADLVAPNPS